MAAAVGAARVVKLLASESELEPRDDMVPHFTTTLSRQEQGKKKHADSSSMASGFNNSVDTTRLNQLTAQRQL